MERLIQELTSINGSSSAPHTPLLPNQHSTEHNITVRFGDYIRDSWHIKSTRHAKRRIELIPESTGPEALLSRKKE